MVKNVAFPSLGICILLMATLSIGSAFCQRKTESKKEFSKLDFLEAVFPFEQPEKAKPKTYWTCVLRAIRPEGTGVDRLTLRQMLDGKVELDYCFTPVGVNAQRDKILIENPDVSYEEILGQIAYACFSIRDQRVLENAKEYSEYLSDLRSPVIPFSIFPIHAEKHQIKCERYGEWFSFSWPSVFEPGEPGSELDAWFDSLIKIARSDPQYSSHLEKITPP